VTCCTISPLSELTACQRAAYVLRWCCPDLSDIEAICAVFDQLRIPISELGATTLDALIDEERTDREMRT
jgi:hypothetical protein